MWGSSKLERCPEWAIPEYAWLYPLADGNGSFEVTTLRVIHGKIAAIRPHFTLDTLADLIGIFNKFGLLFIWESGSKKYAHWTGSERPGRLPSKATRGRYQSFAPSVPKSKLDKYLQQYHDDIKTSVGVGVGFGVGFGIGIGAVEHEGGGGAVGVEVDFTADPKSTASAFDAIGFENPFGPREFQAVWIRRFEGRNGAWITETMEATIQECYDKKIAIPPQFYEAKHEVEKRERDEFDSKNKKTPL